MLYATGKMIHHPPGHLLFTFQSDFFFVSALVEEQKTDQKGSSSVPLLQVACLYLASAHMLRAIIFERKHSKFNKLGGPLYHVPKLADGLGITFFLVLILGLLSCM
jgi:hypothetical protein